jgi:hypothetical protein
MSSASDLCTVGRMDELSNKRNGVDADEIFAGQRGDTQRVGQANLLMVFNWADNKGNIYRA